MEHVTVKSTPHLFALRDGAGKAGDHTDKGREGESTERNGRVGGVVHDEDVAVGEGAATEVKGTELHQVAVLGTGSARVVLCVGCCGGGSM